MVKLIGVIMISSVVGLYCAEKILTIRKSVNSLEMLVSMLEYMGELIKSTSITIEKLLMSIISTPYYKNNDIAKLTLKYIKEGSDFSKSWELAINETKLPLQNNPKNILLSLGTILGRMDSESQVNELMQKANLLKIRLDDEKEKMKKVSPLYKALGICGSLAIFIILI